MESHKPSTENVDTLVYTPSPVQKITTSGSLRRVFRNLLHGPPDERDPERTDDELLFAWDNVVRAYGRYVRLQMENQTLDGTLRPSRGSPALGCSFVYSYGGGVWAYGYSFEDLLLTGMTFHDKRPVYLFKEQYRNGSFPLHSIDALVAKYHLWRAGVRSTDVVTHSDTR